FSPDGRWVAYQSDNGGVIEIYVQPFPATGTKFQISNHLRSHNPVWSRDGKDLLYVPGPVNSYIAARIGTQPTMTVIGETTLSRGGMLDGGPSVPRDYDTAHDGRIIGVIRAGQTQATTPDRQMQVVLNWYEELNARVPSK